MVENLSIEDAQNMLFRACTEGGHPAAVHKLVEAFGALDLGAKDKDTGSTALHLAVESGCTDTVRTLLSAGSPIVRNGHTGITSSSKGSGGDTKGRGLTPIEVARRGRSRKMLNIFVAHTLNGVAKGDSRTVDQVLDGGMDPNTKDGSKDQNTLLHWASSFGHANVVQLLLSRGAKATLENASGLTALDEATKGGHSKCAEILRKAMVDAKTTTTTMGACSSSISSSGIDNGHDSKRRSSLGDDNAIVSTNKDKFSNDGKRTDALTWACTKVELAAGDDFVVPVEVKYGGATLSWTFTTLGGDIAFGIENAESAASGSDVQEDEEDEDGMEDIIDVVRTNLPGGTEISGHVKLGQPCRLLVVFDNGHSWMNSKTLSYELKLTYPRRKRSLKHVATTPSDEDIAYVQIIRGCREEMAICRGTLRKAADAVKRAEAARDEKLKIVRDIEAKLAIAKSELSLASDAVVAISETSTQFSGRLRSLLIRSVPKKYAKDAIVSFLSPRDARAWRCTSTRWREYWM